MEPFDAGGIGRARAIRRRVLRRRVAAVVHRRGVLTDDLAPSVDAVGDRRAHAGDGKIETGELPVDKKEAVLLSAGDIEADDVAARVDAFRACLCRNLAGGEPCGTGGGSGRNRALNIHRDERVWLRDSLTGQHERSRNYGEEGLHFRYVRPKPNSVGDHRILPGT
jgi:hypothetical protein